MDTQLDTRPAELVARKWRNLWFLKDGRARFGNIICDSDRAAQALADKVFFHRLDIFFDYPPTEAVIFHDICFAIPMPIL